VALRFPPIAEKKKLWEFYQNEVEIDLPITRVVRLQIDGNMAWLAAELIFKVRARSAREVWPQRPPAIPRRRPVHARRRSTSETTG
jgi:hypothetical protein